MKRREIMKTRETYEEVRRTAREIENTDFKYYSGERGSGKVPTQRHFIIDSRK